MDLSTVGAVVVDDCPSLAIVLVDELSTDAGVLAEAESIVVDATVDVVVDVVGVEGELLGVDGFVSDPKAGAGAPVVGSDSVDLLTGSTSNLGLLECGWKSAIILLSFPLGSSMLLKVIIWSWALALDTGEHPAVGEANFGASSDLATSAKLRATLLKQSRYIAFLFGICI